MAFVVGDGRRDEFVIRRRRWQRPPRQSGGGGGGGGGGVSSRLATPLVAPLRRRSFPNFIVIIPIHLNAFAV